MQAKQVSVLVWGLLVSKYIYIYIYVYLEKTLTSKSSASAFSDSEHSELHLFEVCEFLQVSHMASHGFTSKA